MGIVYLDTAKDLLKEKISFLDYFFSYVKIPVIISAGSRHSQTNIIYSVTLSVFICRRFTDNEFLSLGKDMG